MGEAFAAVRVKSVRGRGGFVRNVRYQNIHADSVLSGVWVDMNYQVVPDCTPKPECIPIFSNITVENLTVQRQVRALPKPFSTAGTTAGAAFTLVGLPESTLDVSLKRVRVFKYAQAQECTHANIVASKLVPSLFENASTECRVADGGIVGGRGAS